jgi:hypothetical protein
MNNLFNETEKREFHFVVNGKNSSSYPGNKLSMIFTGIRCIGGCVTAVAEKETESDVRKWSDAKNWPNETLPKEGDVVEIQPGWNMELDVNVTPIFDMLKVNGRLSFKRGMNITLNAKHIFVRAGELLIGNETHPFEDQATIMLHGRKRD